MTLFQLLGIAGSLLAVIVVVGAIRRHRLAPGPGALWVLLWTAAGVLIARPEWSVVLARSLGIARGADLVFYLAILGAMVGFLAVYIRLRRLESQLTRVVRELALVRAQTESEGEPDGRS